MITKAAIYLVVCVAFALGDTFSIGHSNQGGYPQTRLCNPQDGCTPTIYAPCVDGIAFSNFNRDPGCSTSDPFMDGRIDLLCCPDCDSICDADGDDDVDLGDFEICFAAFKASQ